MNLINPVKLESYLPSNKEKLNFQYKINKHSIYGIKLENAFINLNANSIINKNLNYFLGYETFFREEKIFNNYIINNQKYLFECKNCKINKKSVFFLPTTNNYWHFIIDCLPRLFFFKKIKIINIAIDSRLNKKNLNFIKLVLKKLKIKNYKFVKIDNCISKFEYIYFTKRLNINFVKYFYQKLFKEKKLRNNYFISRSDAKYRKLLNEKKIFDLIKNFNYKIVYSENLPIIKQIKLFQNVKNIIAPHGAGLANIIFSSNETKVVELTNSFIQKDTVELLSKVMGHKFYRIEGKSITSHQNPNFNDFFIDENYLKNVINLYNVK